MLEKDKKCIEFSMCTMMLTHKPYQEGTEIAITGMIPGCENLTKPKPFDIPCDVVIVPKKEFERLQTENEELKKKLNAFDPVPEYKEFLKKLYSIEDAENLEWALNHICGGRGSVNGWIAVSLFCKQNYEALSKLVGFSSVEEIEDYLVNEAEADTLHEAISNLKDQVKYTVEEWTDRSKKLKECEKDYISERDKAEALEKEIEVYSRTLREWKEGTCCTSPSGAKTLIESGASWHHAYNEIKAANEKLGNTIKQWQEATGCDTPDKARSSIADMMNGKETTIYLGDTHNVIARWQKVTGFNEPKDFLKWKANIEGILEAWKSGTGCKYPAEARILLEKWKVLTKCETPEAAATWITSYESACERGNELAEKVEEWKKATGCDTPGMAEEKLKYYKDRLGNAVQAASCATKHLGTIAF